MTSRLRTARDRGFTLVELLIVMIIFSVLIALVFTVLIQMMNMSKDTIARSDSIQQARLGVSQIELQVRSGAVIRDPELEDASDSGVDPYHSMRILTELNGNPTCAQWRVIDSGTAAGGNLEFRTWDPSYPVDDDVSDWGVVARDIVLQPGGAVSATDIDADDPGTWPPFWVDSSGGGDSEAQFVRVTLRVKNAAERAEALPTSVTTMITGRNTVFGNYTDESCAPVPAP